MDDVRQQNQQDAELFEGLLESHRGILFKVANTYCWCSEDRADLLQEMATQLWRSWPNYDQSRPFSTWIYRVALNVSISYVREHSTRHRYLVSIHDAHDKAPELGNVDFEDDFEAKRNLLHGFIQKQSAIDRALLLLYLESLPQREIGEILGLTESNVSTKIGRLKQRLRDEL